MTACFKGHLELVKVLIRAGADVHASNYRVSQKWHSSTGLVVYLSNQLGRSTHLVGWMLSVLLVGVSRSVTIP